MEILFLIYSVILFYLNKSTFRDMFAPIYPVTMLVISYIGAIVYGNNLLASYEIKVYDQMIFFTVIFILLIPSIISSINNKEIYIDKPKFLPFTKILIFASYFIILAMYLYIEFYLSGVVCAICQMFARTIKYVPVDNIHRFGKESQFQILIAQLPLFATFLIIIFYDTKNKLHKILLLFMICIVPMLGVIKTSKSDVIFSMLLYFIIIYYYYV